MNTETNKNYDTEMELGAGIQSFVFPSQSKKNSVIHPDMNKSV